MRADILKKVVNSLKEKEIVPVYTHVLPQTEYPYITIAMEEFAEGGMNLPGMRRYRTTLKVQAWSRKPNAGEIAILSAHILAQLGDKNIEGLSLRVIKDATQILNDGVTRLYTAEFQGGGRS